MLTAIFYLLGAAGVIGGLMAWSHRSRLRQLESQVQNLQRQLNVAVEQSAVVTREKAEPAEHQVPDAKAEPQIAQTPAQQEVQEGTQTAAQRRAQAASQLSQEVRKQKPPKTPDWTATAGAHLKQHWMIWLGGICVGLAGVFLVRYTIEQGLLGPGARILLGVTTGVILHAVALWLRNRTGEDHPSFAALAGGASIMLYAAILAALRLYDLLSPGTTFALLAMIALSTMALSLLHGPILAIIGLLGAYVVPILVSDGSGRVVIALIYSLIISGAALLLMRYVYRVWLWLGMLIGALGWWVLSLASGDADGLRGYYLATLAYGMLAVSTFHWLLQTAVATASSAGVSSWLVDRTRLQPVQSGLAAVVVAHAISIAQSGVTADALLLWSPLVVVCILAARMSSALAFLPWLMMVSHWFAWLYCGLGWSDGATRLGLDAGEQVHFLQYAIGTAVLYSALSWWAGRGQPFSQMRVSLVAMAPILWMALAYILVSELSVNWQWSVAAIALGALYLYLSRNELSQNREKSAVWFILGGHLAYSLAVAMLFREATLTLALAAQLVSLAWLIKRFQLQNLDWLVKVILGVVLLRLTLNPWLLRYPADVHWSFWTYGGSTLCAWAAMWLTPADAALRKWLAAAVLQLLVLFLAAETRYWLYDGEIFAREYSLIEAAINSFLWSGLGLAYYLRADVAQTLRPVYLKAALVLLLIACYNQLLVLTRLNPLWSEYAVGTTQIFNILSLAYGLPAVMAYLVYRYYDPAGRKIAAGVAAASAFVCVSLHIRHLWQGAVDIDLPTSDGELYTYSAVWLVIAAAAILYAGWRQRRDLYLAGMGLLLLVVAKLFLVDMAGLEGLWRVASFMGLGLSLLTLAFLYQRQNSNNTSEHTSEPDHVADSKL